ncbi:MAG: glycosyltransferase family 4 protein [Wenzhouxiangella sp.]|jgi:Fuc2NAc and GlcNAc transferase|nr:glycosyltransferase family 4 protein [Wenzhouxiangella sp.]
MLELLLPLCLSMLMTVVLVLPLRGWLVMKGLVDQPGGRRSHEVATPRGGGLAMVVAVLIVVNIFAVPSPAIWGISGLVLLLAGLGWLDDASDLPVKWRFGMQLLIAAMMLALTGTVDSVAFGSLELNWPWLWSGLGLVAVVWLINLHNFMDGSDGLLAMQGAWTGLAMAALMHPKGGIGALLAIVMAGACLGFLLWNRPPARVFMGDSGSLLIGGLVGLLALSGAASGLVSIWVSLIITALFVVDATATLVRRVVRGSRWYNAHREHAYQKLISGGWSHGRVLLLYGSMNLLIVLPVLLLANRFPDQEMLLALGLVGLLTFAWWRLHDTLDKEANQQ